MGFMVLGYRMFVTVTCFTASLRERWELLAVLDSIIKRYGSCNCNSFHITLLLVRCYQRDSVAIQ